MIELFAIFAVLAGVWGVIGARKPETEDVTAVAEALYPRERGSAGRRMLG